MIHSFRAGATWLLMAGITATATAQQYKGKFEQLGTEFLPTPNGYRTASGSPGPNYWQQRADYDIEVAINDETQELTGKEKITYYNQSPETLRYLWLQLDQNLFARNSLREQSKTSEVYDSLPAYLLPYMGVELSGYEGGFKIESVTTEGANLPYVINQTMMRIDLPKPLGSGETFTFSIAWRYREYERMMFHEGRGGYEYFPDDGNYVYTFAQWYPRMCVFDDYEGWQNKQFLGQGEFALTFGNFSVRITVPADHIVGATGQLQNAHQVLSREQQVRLQKARESFDNPVFIVTEDEARAKEKKRAKATSTWEFEASNVRDFAFATSRKFIWDAMAVRTGAKTPMAMSLYPKEGNPLWAKESTRAVKNTLEEYSARTFDYPYPVAYSVHTADIGMEYPMICFNYGRPAKNGRYSELTRSRMIGVIVHEVGHNFFPMIVNSDERQWTWMDEGLNTFLEGETVRKRYPELNYTDGLPSSSVSYMRGDPSQMRPVMTTSDNIREEEYGPNAYTKPAAALTILRNVVMGPELFDKAFKEYANRWAFKHPKPADFFRTMEDASAVDLDWFWRGWFYSTDRVDVKVAEVKWFRLKESRPTLEGIGQQNTSRDVKSPSGKNTNVFDQPQELSLTTTPESVYREFRNRLDDKAILQKLSGKNIYEVTFENVGGLVSPVIIQWIYKNGSRETETLPAEVWRTNEAKFSKVFVKEKEVQAIRLDPGLATGDVDVRNNVFPPAPGSAFDKFKNGEEE
jgi:hypothetical protein